LPKKEIKKLIRQSPAHAEYFSPNSMYWKERLVADFKNIPSTQRGNWIYVVKILKYTAKTFCNKIEKILSIEPYVDTRCASRYSSVKNENKDKSEETQTTSSSKPSHSEEAHRVEQAFDPSSEKGEFNLTESGDHNSQIDMKNEDLKEPIQNQLVPEKSDQPRFNSQISSTVDDTNTSKTSHSQTSNPDQTNYKLESEGQKEVQKVQKNTHIVEKCDGDNNNFKEQIESSQGIQIPQINLKTSETSDSQETSIHGQDSDHELQLTQKNNKHVQHPHNEEQSVQTLDSGQNFCDNEKQIDISSAPEQNKSDVGFHKGREHISQDSNFIGVPLESGQKKAICTTSNQNMDVDFANSRFQSLEVLGSEHTSQSFPSLDFNVQTPKLGPIASKQIPEEHRESLKDMETDQQKVLPVKINNQTQGKEPGREKRRSDHAESKSHKKQKHTSRKETKTQTEPCGYSEPKKEQNESENKSLLDEEEEEEEERLTFPPQVQQERYSMHLEREIEDNTPSSGYWIMFRLGGTMDMVFNKIRTIFACWIFSDAMWKQTYSGWAHSSAIVLVCFERSQACIGAIMALEMEDIYDLVMITSKELPDEDMCDELISQKYYDTELHHYLSRKTTMRDVIKSLSSKCAFLDILAKYKHEVQGLPNCWDRRWVCSYHNLGCEERYPTYRDLYENKILTAYKYQTGTREEKLLLILSRDHPILQSKFIDPKQVDQIWKAKEINRWKVQIKHARFDASTFSLFESMRRS
jgi:hypothetical protein